MLIISYILIIPLIGQYLLFILEYSTCVLRVIGIFKVDLPDELPNFITIDLLLLLILLILMILEVLLLLLLLRVFELGLLRLLLKVLLLLLLC